MPENGFYRAVSFLFLSFTAVKVMIIITTEQVT